MELISINKALNRFEDYGFVQVKKPSGDFFVFLAFMDLSGRAYNDRE